MGPFKRGRRNPPTAMPDSVMYVHPAVRLFWVIILRAGCISRMLAIPLHRRSALGALAFRAADTSLVRNSRAAVGADAVSVGPRRALIVQVSLFALGSAGSRFALASAVSVPPSRPMCSTASAAYTATVPAAAEGFACPRALAFGSRSVQSWHL